MRAERHHGAPLLVSVETFEQATREEATEQLVQHREQQEAHEEEHRPEEQGRLRKADGSRTELHPPRLAPQLGPDCVKANGTADHRDCAEHHHTKDGHRGAGQLHPCATD